MFPCVHRRWSSNGAPQEFVDVYKVSDMHGILLIPFKSLATAKQRLRDALNPQQR